MKRIYLAGPMFCAAEKTFNEEVTELLESSGYSVFLPQRDGTEVLTDDMTEEQKPSPYSTRTDRR